MGATVSTGMAAAIKKTGQGDLYLLFEETFEKNVYPHTPRWSCVCAGTRDHAIRRIYFSAGSCEGGMLKGKSGDIKPENYIRRWEKVLNAPYEYLGDLTGTLPGPYMRPGDQDLEMLLSQLTGMGLVSHEDAQLMREGKSVQLDVCSFSPQAIGNVFGGGRDGVVGAWRTNARYSPIAASTNPVLDTTPEKKKGGAPLAEMRVLSWPLDRCYEAVFADLGDGRGWRFFDNTTSMVQEVIVYHAAKAEVETGDGLRLIAQARKALASMQALPASAQVIISNRPQTRWYAECFAAVAKTLGLDAAADTLCVSTEKIIEKIRGGYLNAYQVTGLGVSLAGVAQ